MGVMAAVMTGKGVGAISTAQIAGMGAGKVLGKVFIPAGGGKFLPETGQVVLGDIIDGSERIDRVVVGCEGVDSFAINCHGSPLIVKLIMELLQNNGAEVVSAERLLQELFAAEASNSIELEAKVAQVRAVTVAGTRLIANQAKGGLAAKVQEWLEQIDSVSPDELRREAAEIIEAGRAGRLIMYGAKVVLAGPVNSGKSTLMNRLCGGEKSIVAETAGTTRDWVWAVCGTEELVMELFDTAGLDRGVLLSGAVEQSAQQRTAEIIEQADVVVLVLDGLRPAEQLEELALEALSDKKVLTAINKCDQPVQLEAEAARKVGADVVRISALRGDGVDKLVERISVVAQVVGFDLNRPVAFTDRQQRLLQELADTKDKAGAKRILQELLNGEVRV